MNKEKRERIPDRITPGPEIGLRLRWKYHLRQLDRQCRKATGNSLAELIVELQIEAAHKRAKARRSGRAARKAVDSPAAL